MKLNTEEFFQTIFNEACFLETKKKTTEEFIAQAKQIRPEYDYSKINYVNNREKVIIGCPKHGEFLMTPNNLLRGQGCPKCAGKHRPTNDEFIEKSKQVHPEYDYSKVNYVNNREKVIIGCPKHGEFLMKPNNLLSGQGCPKCGRESSSHIRSSNTDEFIDKAKKNYPEYDYSKVNYVSAKKEVIINCLKHGDFLIKPAALLSGHGCPKCGREILAKLFSSNTREFIAQAKQIRPEYDYSKVNYVNCKEKVIIGCPKHGEFLMTPNNLLRGQGCPRCSESKGERAIRTWLENQKINFSDQHRFYDLKSYPYDFYLPEYNLVIEYNGIQHYEATDFFHRENGDFEGQLMRDHIKKDYAEKNGYDLLVIPYWEFKNIDKILSEKLA